MSKLFFFDFKFFDKKYLQIWVVNWYRNFASPFLATSQNLRFDVRFSRIDSDSRILDTENTKMSAEAPAKQYITGVVKQVLTLAAMEWSTPMTTATFCVSEWSTVRYF